MVCYLLLWNEDDEDDAGGYKLSIRKTLLPVCTDDDDDLCSHLHFLHT